MDNKYKPIPFWSWNDELEEKELINQIDWMNQNGIGGFFMHARGGLTTPYLGDKWFKCVEACLKKAKELNMEAYAYDENGWPSGFAGGALLEDELNRDMYLTYAYGKFDKNAVASFDVNGPSLKRVNSGDNVLNVYSHTSTSTADILNKEVVRKFINLTHEQYKKHDIYGNLRGFFTDEPQYYRWRTSFTRVLPQYFKEKYQEDIYDRIGLLFVDKEGYEDYLMVMLLIFVPSDAVFERTRNLVELNVNCVDQDIGNDGTLSQLTFKMSEAYTAVKATCSVSSGFVFMPDGFAQTLLGASSDTYQGIKDLEDNTYSYSVIRGY